MSARIIRNNATAIIAKFETKAMRLLDKYAFDVESIAKVSIQTGSKSGRTYNLTKKKGRGGKSLKRARKIVHQASAPGEAPANLYGGLANGIMVQAPIGNRLRRFVISTQAYSRRLEIGLNRPFLRPAFEKVKPVFILALRREMRR